MSRVRGDADPDRRLRSRALKGETLFGFCREQDHTRWLCERRDHGEYRHRGAVLAARGISVVPMSERDTTEFLYSRRCNTRARALQWDEAAVKHHGG